MRIFYLTSEFPWPTLHGGRVRSVSQLRLLLAQPELLQLRMFSLCEVPVTDAEIAAFRQSLGQPATLEVGPPTAHPIHLRQHKRKLAEVALRRLLRGTPYLLAKWYSRTVEDELSKQLKGPWDVVYIDHLGMAMYLPLVRKLCPTARVVLECHNVESEFFAQFASQLPLPLRLLAEREHQAAAEHESRILCEVDAVVAISERDAARLRALVMARLGRAVTPLTVSPVVELAPVELSPALSPRVIYLGNLTWHPNVAGLDWLCQQVWPKVRARVPAATLTIGGSGLTKDASGRLQIPSLWQGPGIEVIGFVPELTAFVEKAVALAAPVFGGSGVRIKLLDALRLGIPTVTTQDGASGLPLTDGQQVLISDDPTGFAERLAQLCQQKALRTRLRENGLQFLREHHSPQRAHTALRMALGLPVGQAAV